MLTREQLVQIQNNLAIAYTDAVRANRAAWELAEIMDSMHIVQAAAKAL